MDNIEAEILDKLWELDEGFFGKLRHGVFDEAAYTDAYKILFNWPENISDCINKNVVSGKRNTSNARKI